ncbi:FAD dependent oxidoreductase-domain-containing protein [Crepidotus variabilis]|uniref:FAD dependent oxidoreductase-domain-containing protein n=1 Tax=Crepidotus variabilis TaxID=179855 RepID=A0A9P6JMD8_9AGAR|nr:FAD dependent oxidoreductase-domain-containing protein [Crepidotus variabilis]
MGAQISALYSTLKSIIHDYNVLYKRISASPGIPVPNSSTPFWQFPNSPIAQHGADARLPLEADVVIIGSGISGTAVARTLLEYPSHKAKDQSGATIHVVMLEARDACSGATGRNGGHACPNVYNEYADLKAHHGAAAAIEILRFRLAHIETLIEVAEEEGLLEASQVRIVDDYDAFMHPDLIRQMKAQLDEFLREVPEDLAHSFEVIEEREALNDLQLSNSFKACIVKPGASLHPYRLVTGILANLLSRHSNFQLFTRTPCTTVRTDNAHYIVSTPKGDIRTFHVIHATNAWASHLLPGMRKKIIPMRAHMSAQRPGQGLAIPADVASTSLPKRQGVGSRAFVFYPSSDAFVFDYLTQLKPSDPFNPPKLPTNGEMMYGGGAALGGVEGSFFASVGLADDNETHFPTEAYLSGSLERYFGHHWGQESIDEEETSPTNVKWSKGRVTSVWSGIIGISVDFQPWIGRVPKIASGRREPSRTAAPEDPESGTIGALTLASPGEWISAGFTGEGMVHAWLSGKMLAKMILGDESFAKDDPPPIIPVASSSSGSSARRSRRNSRAQSIDSDGETVMTQTEVGDEDLPLPKAFLITSKRVKKAKVENLMSEFM